MFKIIICLLIFLNLYPADAAITRAGSSFYNNNGFQSKLNMNRPKTIISSYGDYNRPAYNPYNYYDPYYRPVHCPECCPHNYGYPAINQGRLSDLEKYALGQRYRRESDLQRLERLESLAFGAIQSGDINSRYRNVESAILSRPQNNYNVKRSLINNLANYFGGQATGFTPSITSGFMPMGGFSNGIPSPGFGNTTIEQYSNGIFGGGYGVSQQGFTNGSSVKILD